MHLISSGVTACPWNNWADILITNIVSPFSRNPSNTHLYFLLPYNIISHIFLMCTFLFYASNSSALSLFQGVILHLMFCQKSGKIIKNIHFALWKKNKNGYNVFFYWTTMDKLTFIDGLRSIWRSFPEKSHFFYNRAWWSSWKQRGLFQC